MRKFGLAVLTLALAVLVGGTTVGCKRTDKGGTAKAQIELQGPRVSPNVTQGNEATAELTIDPNEKFTGKVGLKAVSKSEGLEVKGLSKDSVDITADKDQTVTLTVKAKETAKPGEHSVEVTATPPKGNAATIMVKFDVEEREATDDKKTDTKKKDKDKE